MKHMIKCIEGAFKAASRRMPKKHIISGLIVLGVPVATMAADMEAFGPEKGDWELTLGGSGSSDRDFDSGGFGFSGSVGYFLTDRWELALRQSYNFDTSGGDSWNASSRGAIDFHFDLDRLQPFVGVNFGGLYGKSTVDSWAAGLEAGLKFYVKPKTFMFVQGEYDWFFKDSDRIDNNFDDGAFVYSLGIGFNF